MKIPKTLKRIVIYLLLSIATLSLVSVVACDNSGVNGPLLSEQEDDGNTDSGKDDGGQD
ncbi:MAG: hypothetical protein ACE5G1_01640 [bacterium]